MKMPMNGGMGIRRHLQHVSLKDLKDIVIDIGADMKTVMTN